MHENTVQSLFEVDRAFSAMAVREGMGKAFIAYADEAVILMRAGNQMPLIGKAALAAAFEPLATTALSWEPLKAEIAASGELGYTFGRYRMAPEGAAVAHGTYTSIWKKQADGSWKFVLDAGAPSPEEVPSFES
jgi:ketosteroid isomerase-like protein